ncbi:MAG TPA: hypothetical protein VFE65_29525 [Pseudonocardia sp.]|nr:hypothetical protein [Pseudonocardia sp.]
MVGHLGVTVNPEHTIECVAERRQPVRLIRVGPSGVDPWLSVSVRTVRAFQRGVVAVWAVVVGACAALMRPMLAGTPGWLHGLIGVAVTLAGGLIVVRLSDVIFRRVVESVVVDTVTALQREPETDDPELGATSSG